MKPEHVFPMLFLLLSLSYTGFAADPQKLVQYFEKKALLIKSPRLNEAAALKELSETLTRILGPVQFNHPPKGSVYQPESLSGEIGSDCVDAIRYWFQSPELQNDEVSNVVVTDLALIEKFQSLSGRKDPLPFIMEKLIDGLACMHSFNVNMGVINGVSKNRFDDVYAFLSYMHQDIGPWPPNQLFVAALRGKQFYLIRTPLEQSKLRNNKCLGAWSAKTSENEKKDFDKLTLCYRKTVGSDKQLVSKLVSIANSALAFVK